MARPLNRPASVDRHHTALYTGLITDSAWDRQRRFTPKSPPSRAPSWIIQLDRTMIPRGIPSVLPTNKVLVGEQSNTYRILLRYDRKSRHRRIKKQRRYERLAATSQFFGPTSLRMGNSSYLDPVPLPGLHLTERFSAAAGASVTTGLPLSTTFPEPDAMPKSWNFDCC